MILTMENELLAERVNDTNDFEKTIEFILVPIHKR